MEKQAHTRKNRIFVETHTQFKNLGDLVINRNLISLLRDKGEVIVNDIGLPTWYCQELGLKATEQCTHYNYSSFKPRILKARLKSLLMMQASKEEIYIIDIPGDIPRKGRRERALKTVALYFLLKILGVKICKLGFSISKLDDMKGFEERWKSKFMHFYGVRDSISRAYAASIGIKNISYFPDFAWMTETEYVKKAESRELDVDMIEHIFSSPFKNDVLVSFRESTHKQDKDDFYQQKICFALDSALHTLSKRGECHGYVTYQVDSDKDFSCEIAERYSDFGLELIDEKVSLDSFESIYGNFKWVFSNRLHVLLLAALSGSLPIPVVSVKRQPKIVGIFEDANLTSLIVDIDQPSDIKERIEEIALNAKYIQEQLKDQISLNRENGVRIADKIFA